MPDFYVRDVGVRYGGVTALEAVSLEVRAGSVVGLIGPNGAGKTTLINASTGFARLASGSISLGERRIDRLAPHRIARAGIARTYQNIRLFGTLDVRANLAAGAFALSGRLHDEAARALLERTGIPHVALAARAATLPYGDQRRLEIARALAAQPAVLLLDEPAAGMNSTETTRLIATMRTIATSGVAILLIEHDMSLVRAICDELVVLNFGTVLTSGPAREVMNDPAVLDAYLGTAVP